MVKSCFKESIFFNPSNKILEKHKYVIHSIRMNNVLDFLKLGSPGAKALLRHICQRTRICNGGHDLATPISMINDHLARNLDVSRQTIAAHKEFLHASGIILIDGLTWQEYRGEVHGKLLRFKTHCVQTITLTEKFVEWMRLSATLKKNHPIIFEAHPEYVTKMQQKVAANRESKARHFIKMAQAMLIEKGITVWNSCETVSMECTPPKAPEVHIPDAHISRDQDKKLIQYEDNPNRGYGFDPQVGKPKGIIGGLSRSLDLKAAINDIRLKKWTDDATNFCAALLSTGKTYQEVGLKMIEQRYARSMDHFRSLYPPPDR
jgi:hypothetical protein